jgi:sigma-B regulation protein RsbU (phosphoserine phosphatase)
MTLFFGEIDSIKRTIRWVRAGHDPALLFDPQTNAFEELKGSGIALGLDQEWVYTENIKKDLKNGQILIFCTDGVWEAHNSAGEMFGKHALHKIIAQNANMPAGKIVETVVATVRHFQEGTEPEDDITLVVVKIN